ncbi:nitroreductase [Streptomyces aureoverticillatus]|nr:nitroreductase [Streptomyces aureoverticillatus]
MTGQRTPTPSEHAANHLVRAAVTAPSLHNSQPWLFAYSDSRVLLYADDTRRLPLADPRGRQQVISCGAALFNLRLAMRHLGFRPTVRFFPDTPEYVPLVQVEWGAYARMTSDETLMHRSMRRRHTHRGPFQAASVPASLIEALRQQAHAEGAGLCAMDDPTSQLRLAALVREAEQLRRNTPAYTAELNRWTRVGDAPRDDGVPAEACAFHPDCTALAGRDFTGLTRHPDTAAPPWKWSTRTGITVLLTTPHDSRQDWLRAGQALQRVLLYAAGHNVAAGFHTQPLEVADLRARVRATVPSGQHPQMILRLGYTNDRVRTPRRPVTDVLARDNGLRPTASTPARWREPRGPARGSRSPAQEVTCAAPPRPGTQRGAEPRG